MRNLSITPDTTERKGLDWQGMGEIRFQASDDQGNWHEFENIGWRWDGRNRIHWIKNVKTGKKSWVNMQYVTTRPSQRTDVELVR